MQWQTAMFLFFKLLFYITLFHNMRDELAEYTTCVLVVPSCCNVAHSKSVPQTLL